MWLTGTSLWGQRLEAGDDVEQFLVDATLAQTMKVPIEILQQFFDVLVGALHRCQAARVLTREGFGTRPEERDEKIFANERPEGRVAATHDLGQVPRRPGKFGQLASPVFVQRQQSLTDWCINRPGRGAVVEQVEFGDLTVAAARLALHENLPDQRGDSLDGVRDGEQPHQRQARVRQARVNALTDGPDFGLGRKSCQRLDRMIGHHVIDCLLYTSPSPRDRS